jgi:hypothetical protein
MRKCSLYLLLGCLMFILAAFIIIYNVQTSSYFTIREQIMPYSSHILRYIIKQSFRIF